jgi:calcineurin-like phosphoesterase family protein
MKKIARLLIVIMALAVLSITAFPETLNLLGIVAEPPKAYYLDEITDTAQKVKALTKEPALVFFLCSDVHYNTVKTDNRLKLDSVTDMTTNMAALKKQIPVDGLICLGDIVDAKEPTKAEETKMQVEYVMKRLRGVGLPLIYCMGNHDDNRYAYSVDSTVFSAKQLESMYMSYTLPNRVSDLSTNGLNYYVDYDRHKIRVFALDSNYQDPNKNYHWAHGFSDSTLAWFRDRLKEIPKGWSVMVLAHRRLVQSKNPEKDWIHNQLIMAETVNDFINNGGSYIATVYGHIHRDLSRKEPFLEFSIGSQKCQNIEVEKGNAIAPERKLNTASEDLWDVLVIRPQSRKINTVRFGAGADREWSY